MLEKRGWNVTEIIYCNVDHVMATTQDNILLAVAQTNSALKFSEESREGQPQGSAFTKRTSSQMLLWRVSEIFTALPFLNILAISFRR